MNENEHLNTRRCLFTNADRLRAMSDEELAEWLPFKMGACNMSEKCGNDYTCDVCWLDWLKQEVASDSN